jgi:hypothetical protein
MVARSLQVTCQTLVYFDTVGAATSFANPAQIRHARLRKRERLDDGFYFFGRKAAGDFDAGNRRW